jgi:DNA-binding CsgD family transcriptional regulator
LQFACLVGLTFATWFVAELSNGFFADRFFVVSLLLALALGGYAAVVCHGLQQEKRRRLHMEELLHTSGVQEESRLLVPHIDATRTLTVREVDVLMLLAHGWTNKRIGEELHISLNTVERHTRNIYRKLAVHGRVEATAYALQMGLLAPPRSWRPVSIADSEGSSPTAVQ